MKSLKRFHKAQASMYELALEEIKSGCKKTHWMWFIFPRLEGLGHSSTSYYYSIHGFSEAKAYLADALLKARLIEVAQALLELNIDNACTIFGSPDDLKLKSCMTLFYVVDNSNPIFLAVLNKFFNGEFDHQTINILNLDVTAKI